MCLNKVEKKYRIDKEAPIKAYKVFYSVDQEHFVGPFYDYGIGYTFGREYTARQKEIGLLSIPNGRYLSGFHSFVNKNSAEKYRRSIGHRSAVVIEVLIYGDIVEGRHSYYRVKAKVKAFSSEYMKLVQVVSPGEGLPT